MSWNPILGAHWDLIGRRNQWLVPAAVAGLILFLASITYSTIFSRDPGPFFSGWLGFMTIIQGALYLLVAPSAVRRSVLRDFQTGMIESHRLSPMSGAKVVLGYLTGPVAQAAEIYGVTLVLGGGFAIGVAQSMGAPGGLSYFGSVVGGWYFLQVALATLGFMIATLGLLIALATKGKGNLVGWLVAIGIFGGSVGVALVPGLALLTGVMTGGSIIGALTKAAVTTDPTATLAAMASQATLGAIFAASAARLVRHPERSLFSVFYGMALLVVTAVILAVGLTQSGNYPWLFGRDASDSMAALHMMSSISVLAAVALLPLWAAAWEQHRLEVERAFGAAVEPRRLRAARLAPLAVALLCVASWFAFYRCTPSEHESAPLAQAFARGEYRLAMGAAIFLAIWTIACLLYWGRSRNLRPWFVALVWLLLLCVIPVGVERIMYEVMSAESGRRAAYVPWAATVSPLGTLIACTSYTLNAAVWAGLGAQAAIALGATWLAGAARRRTTTVVARAIAS